MKLNAAKLGNTVSDSMKNTTDSDAVENDDKELSGSGEVVQTSTVDRRPESTIHTNYDLLSSTVSNNKVISVRVMWRFGVVGSDVGQIN